MSIKEKLEQEINHRFYKNALCDFNEQSIYNVGKKPTSYFDEQSIFNFVTNYLIHHRNKSPDNFDFILEDTGECYLVKPMNKDTEEFINQIFITNIL